MGNIRSIIEEVLKDARATYLKDLRTTDLHSIRQYSQIEECLRFREMRDDKLTKKHLKNSLENYRLLLEKEEHPSNVSNYEGRIDATKDVLERMENIYT